MPELDPVTNGRESASQRKQHRVLLKRNDSVNGTYSAQAITQTYVNGVQ